METEFPRIGESVSTTIFVSDFETMSYRKTQMETATKGETRLKRRLSFHFGFCSNHKASQQLQRFEVETMVETQHNHPLRGCTGASQTPPDTPPHDVGAIAAARCPGKENKMERITIKDPRLEEWLRIAFMDDDGQAFLPCGAFGNELKALLCLAHDGAPVIRHNGHIYAPASWLAREHPRYAQAIETIAGSITANRQRNQPAWICILLIRLGTSPTCKQKMAPGTVAVKGTVCLRCPVF